MNKENYLKLLDYLEKLFEISFKLHKNQRELDKRYQNTWKIIQDFHEEIQNFCLSFDSLNKNINLLLSYLPTNSSKMLIYGKCREREIKFSISRKFGFKKFFQRFAFNLFSKFYLCDINKIYIPSFDNLIFTNIFLKVDFSSLKDNKFIRQDWFKIFCEYLENYIAIFLNYNEKIKNYKTLSDFVKINRIFESSNFAYELEFKNSLTILRNNLEYLFKVYEENNNLVSDIKKLEMEISEKVKPLSIINKLKV